MEEKEHATPPGSKAAISTGLALGCFLAACQEASKAPGTSSSASPAAASAAAVADRTATAVAGPAPGTRITEAPPGVEGAVADHSYFPPALHVN